MVSVSRQEWQTIRAAHLVKRGGVVAYPTEAVWGLGCDPLNRYAVEQLLSLKQRPVDKGLILVSGNPEHFRDLLDPLPKDAQSRFYAPVDIPTTWLVPDIRGQVPEWVKGQYNSVACRLSVHPLIRGFCGKLGSAIISTSANPAGKAPATNPLRLRQYFGEQLDYILPGPLGKFRRPSVIRDLETDRVIRA